MEREILQVLDHLPKWAYTEDEWKTEVLHKTVRILNGIRYEKIIIEEPDAEIDQFILDML